MKGTNNLCYFLLYGYSKHSSLGHPLAKHQADRNAVKEPLALLAIEPRYPLKKVWVTPRMFALFLDESKAQGGPKAYECSPRLDRLPSLIYLALWLDSSCFEPRLD